MPLHLTRMLTHYYSGLPLKRIAVCVIKQLSKLYLIDNFNDLMRIKMDFNKYCVKFIGYDFCHYYLL